MRIRLWKLLGVAGLTGVAATGVIIARQQRVRTQLTPDQIRQRLHDRVDAAEREGQHLGGGPAGGPTGGPGAPGSTESSARA